MDEGKSITTTNTKGGDYIYKGPMPDPAEEVRIYSPRYSPPAPKEKDLGKNYEKPVIKPEPEMQFMFRAIKNLPTKITCRQCSSCHSCR